MKALRIIEAQPDDAAFVIQHIKEIASESEYHAISSNEFEQTIEAQVGQIEDFAYARNSIMLLCYLGQDLAGVLTLVGGKRLKTRHCGMLGITFKKAYCNKGYGHLMIKELETWIKETGIIRKVNLIVHEDNVGAIRFYEKLGFLYEGKSVGYFYANAIYKDAIYMGKFYKTGI